MVNARPTLSPESGLSLNSATYANRQDKVNVIRTPSYVNKINQEIWSNIQMILSVFVLIAIKLN
jgi:hypothetical protein